MTSNLHLVSILRHVALSVFWLAFATGGAIAATYTQTAGGPVKQIEVINSAPGTYTVIDGAATATSTATAVAGGSAYAAVTSTAAYNIGSATTSIGYFVTLVGPAGPPVSVGVVASGYVTGSAAVNDYYSADIYFSFNNAGNTLYGNANAKAGGGNQALAVNAAVLLSPNVAYFLGLGANAGCGISVSCSAEAFIDPTFTIDPAFASQYSLSGVPSVSAVVPESATWAMLLVGLSAVGSAARSARRRSAQTVLL